MHVAALRLDLHVPQARSLKDKRAAIKPIVEGARRRYNAAVAEVDYQDQWQRAEIGIAVVSSTPGHAADMLDEVERFVWSFPEIEVVGAERTWVDGG